MGWAIRSNEESKEVKQSCVLHVKGALPAWRQDSLCYQAKWCPSAQDQVREHRLCIWNTAAERGLNLNESGPVHCISWEMLFFLSVSVLLSLLASQFCVYREKRQRERSLLWKKLFFTYQNEWHLSPWGWSQQPSGEWGWKFSLEFFYWSPQIYLLDLLYFSHLLFTS